MQNGKQTLSHIINEGVLQKQEEITIPPATYYCAEPITLAHICHTTFNGAGVRIIMTNPNENGFVFHNCSNITLKGFTIDYDPLPFTQGSVVWRNKEATEFEFEIHEGYRDFESTGRRGFGFRTEVFDSGTLLRKLIVGNPSEKRIISPRRGYMKCATAAPTLELGDYFAFASREKDFVASAIEFKHCSTVRLEDLTILASPGMAVYCADMDGENYFRYTVTRGPQGKYGVPRLLSTNGDGFHYRYGRRGPVIEQCDFSFMGDDSVNINGPCFVVKKIEDRNMFWVETGKNNALCFRSIRKGDTIRFMSPENYDIIAKARIKSVEEINGTVARILCDRPLKLSGNEYCNVFDFNCPGFYIRDSYFHDHRAVGLRIFGTDGVIENNRIERTEYAAINIGPACYGGHDGWGKNIIIRRNKIMDCSLSPGGKLDFPGAVAISAEAISSEPQYKYPRCTRNITIEKNIIKNCGASGIFVNAADYVHIRQNQLERTNQTYRQVPNQPVKAEYAVDVQNSSHLEIADNTMKDPGEFCAGFKRKGSLPDENQ